MSHPILVNRIQKTTRELYDCLFMVMNDTIWDDPYIKSDFLEIAKNLAIGDMDGIRKAFMDGNTALLVRNDMPDLERNENIEIAIFHNDQLIGVLVPIEIQY